MPALLIIRDRDPERRREGIRAVEKAIGQFKLEISSFEHGPFAVVYGVYPGAPVSTAYNAFVLGDAIPGPGPERLTASQYAEKVTPGETPLACDGFHVAATFDEAGALSVGLDALGTFPVFWGESNDALLVASSPGLITEYPGFEAELDPLGVASVLIANGPVRGRTMCKGIYRLEAGMTLVAPPGAGLKPQRSHRLTASDTSHDVTFEECVARMWDAFQESAKRHIPSDVPHTMMLSGGVDSRCVIGVLAQQRVPMNAVTRGQASDLEYKCAHAVARHLGLEHHLVPHGQGTRETFERSLWWSGMGQSPGSAMGTLDEAFPGAHPYLATGYVSDPVLGGVTASKAFDPKLRTNTFEQYLKRTNAWGVPVEVLPKLLRRDVFGDAAEQVVAEFREEVMSSGESWLARSWVHTTGFRERLAGSHMCARLAFRAWPRQPVSDRRLAEVTGGIPLNVLGDRRVQRQMLETYMTDLARLPLDRKQPGHDTATRERCGSGTGGRRPTHPLGAESPGHAAPRAALLPQDVRFQRARVAAAAT